jgi:hypothetical protein
MNNISLTGKCGFKNNMLGKSIYLIDKLPEDINKLKTKIINNIILPLLSKQWDVLKENLYCLDSLKKKLDYYYKTHKIYDLFLYKELLLAFEVIISEHTELEELEKKIYGSKTDLTTMVFKTTMIKLKPEYEIYGIIYGKPDKNLNQKYNEYIIRDIELLLRNDSITFQKIKEYILLKYPI